MTTLYGIKNCDTVKKARVWLDQHQVNYRFHDFRTDGLDETTIRNWVETLGLDTLVNKRSTTWKELNDQVKHDFNEHNAVAIIAAHPTLIKRPLLETGSHRLVGFKDADYQRMFL